MVFRTRSRLLPSPNDILGFWPPLTSSTRRGTDLRDWTKLKDEVKTFREVDDLGVVFGSRTRGFGHEYQTLPVVPEKELAEFERRTALELPLEYRTYLQVFGAGGAGPDYGIYDFRETVQHEDFSIPFPFTETTYSLDEDYSDDDPVWDMPGTALICSHGCGIESAIELNGQKPGYLVRERMHYLGFGKLLRRLQGLGRQDPVAAREI